MQWFGSEKWGKIGGKSARFWPLFLAVSTDDGGVMLITYKLNGRPACYDPDNSMIVGKSKPDTLVQEDRLQAVGIVRIYPRRLFVLTRKGTV